MSPKKLVSYADTKAPKQSKGGPKGSARIKKRSRTKGGRGSDPAKVAWLHTRACASCGARPVEVHHDRHLGSRATDKRTVPLCALHHMIGPLSVGQLGRARFQEVHGINMDVTVARYETEWKIVKAYRKRP